MLATDIPFNQYTDLNGKPLDGGKVYFGQPNQNPETAPLTVYWDAAGTQPAAQPVRVQNGFTIRAGTIANVFSDVDYSITVRDSRGRLVYYSPTSTAFNPAIQLQGSGGAALVGYAGSTLDVILKSNIGKVVTSIAALRLIDKTKYAQALTTGYYLAGDGGGGVFYYDSADTTSADNGGTLIVAADGGRWKLAQNHTVGVKQFGAKGDGTTDDTARIQAAINWRQTNGGGSIYFATGTYVISSTLTIGNGTATVFSTLFGVQLVGDGGGVIPGPNNMSAVTFKSNVAGPAITIQGPIGSWGIENICLVANTTSTLAVGLNVISGQGGRARNLTVTGFYGVGIIVTAIGTGYLSEHNMFENTSLFLPPSGAMAIGMLITGEGATGGSLGTAFDSWHNTYMVLTNAGQVGRVLQYCDNINFHNTEIVNAANATATQYNYSSTGLNGSSFPSDCHDFGIDVYGNSTLNFAPSGIGPFASPNRVYGFSTANGAPIPSLPNLSILNEAGTSKVMIYLNGAQSLGAMAKVLLDTKTFDNDLIADVVTNRRITPIRKGYYQVDAQVTVSSFAGPSLALCVITKNGASQQAVGYISNNGVSATSRTSALVFFNGTTDYVELFSQVTGGSTALTAGATTTFMSLLGPF